MDFLWSAGVPARRYARGVKENEWVSIIVIEICILVISIAGGDRL